MTQNDAKHVFLSYVHEDRAEVDRLCALLEAANIPYWRDRTSLGPGDAWKVKIREAIRDDSMVFLACFSDNSRVKETSYMNEELTLAVDEFRKRPPGRTWLVPVRFDAGDVPEWDLGAGRTIRDLQYSDLFGDGYLTQAATLITKIRGLIGHVNPQELARRRRSATYDSQKLTFTTLLTIGPALLVPYQAAAKKLGEQLDVWDKAALLRLSKKIAIIQQEAVTFGLLQADQVFFGPGRVSLLRTIVEIALPRAMSDLTASISYLDEEVAHAISQFPNPNGIQMLQVRVEPDGGIAPVIDVHIVWTLLEAGRRLYSALLGAGAYDRSIFVGTWTPDGQESVSLSDDVLFQPPRQQGL